MNTASGLFPSGTTIELVVKRSELPGQTMLDRARYALGAAGTAFPGTCVVMDAESVPYRLTPMEAEALCEEGFDWAETVQASAPDGPEQVAMVRHLLERFPMFGASVVLGQKAYGCSESPQLLDAALQHLERPEGSFRIKVALTGPGRGRAVAERCRQQSWTGYTVAGWKSTSSHLELARSVGIPMAVYVHQTATLEDLATLGELVALGARGFVLYVPGHALVERLRTLARNLSQLSSK